MTTFLLIRHAAYAAMGTTLVGRSPGIHLNDTGQTQAQELAERLAHLPIRAIYSSPLERTHETAVLIAERLGLDVIISDSLQEIDFGAWQGRTFAELYDDPRWQRWNNFRSATAPPGGETMLQAQARIVHAIMAWCEQHPYDHVVVVSHSDMLKAALTYFLGMPLDLFHRIELRPASVSGLEVDDDGSRVTLLNHTETI